MTLTSPETIITSLHDLMPRARERGFALVAPGSLPPGTPVVAVVVRTEPGQGAGLSALDPDAVPHRGLSIDRDSRTATLDGRELTLTRREFDLLAHLQAHPGRVHTRDQLLRAAWGERSANSPGLRTVDVHVVRLRHTLGADHAPRLQTLRGVGYRWIG